MRWDSCILRIMRWATQWPQAVWLFWPSNQYSWNRPRLDKRHSAQQLHWQLTLFILYTLGCVHVRWQACRTATSFTMDSSYFIIVRLRSATLFTIVSLYFITIRLRSRSTISVLCSNFALAAFWRRSESPPPDILQDGLTQNFSPGKNSLKCQFNLCHSA